MSCTCIQRTTVLGNISDYFIEEHFILPFKTTNYEYHFLLIALTFTENNLKVVFTPVEAPSAKSIGAISIVSIATIGVAFVAVDSNRLRKSIILALQAIRALVHRRIGLK